MPEQCNRCRFWREDMVFRDENNPNYGFGDCRRRPPQLLNAIVEKQLPTLRYGERTEVDLDASDLTTASRHPATFAQDWCGEFEDANPVVPV